MLTLVHSEDGPAGNITRAERQRHFPCLLRHDQGTEASLGLTTEENESSILLLTDLGSLVDCLEFLTINAETFVSDNIPSLLGDSVGKILAGFHTTELQNAPAPLRNDFTKDLVFMAAVKPLETHLAHLPNCQQLCKRVEEDYLYPNYDYPGVLCHGDIHSGSVLITKNGGDAHPVVIDMEFAKLGGRGVNGDVSQFLASIHCGLIAAELNRDDASVAAISNFVKKFCTAYRNGTRWIYSVREGAGNQGAQLMRSCFILHGREMINYAYDSCKVETHRKKMVQIGVWYLEQAADDVEGFTDKRRQEEFKTEHGLVIQSLFKLESDDDRARSTRTYR